MNGIDSETAKRTKSSETHATQTVENEKVVSAGPPNRVKRIKLLHKTHLLKFRSPCESWVPLLQQFRIAR